VRPGQLDDEQVDSQIGSGFIEISRIELADEVRSYVHQTALPHTKPSAS
jgi:hypothetical protein